MKKFFNKMLLLPFGVWAMIAIISVASADTNLGNQNVDVQLTITGGTLTHGAPSSIDYGTIGLPSASTDFEQAFSGSFWVEDFKGIDSGYYTTISVSDLVGQDTNSVISNSNIEIRSVTGLVLEAGNTNTNVTMGTIDGTYQSFTSPVTFIERATGANNGVLSRYGTTPDLKVTVPAYQAPDFYTGVITYTLYER